MAKHIHIYLHAARTADAGDFEESKHPRAANGQFGSGGGGKSKDPVLSNLAASEARAAQRARGTPAERLAAKAAAGKPRVTNTEIAKELSRNTEKPKMLVDPISYRTSANPPPPHRFSGAETPERALANVAHFSKFVNATKAELKNPKLHPRRRAQLEEDLKDYTEKVREWEAKAKALKKD